MQHIGDFNFPRLADFGAAISGANKLQCQEVLEELDVSRYLTNSFKISGRYIGLDDILGKIDFYTFLRQEDQSSS